MVRHQRFENLYKIEFLLKLIFSVGRFVSGKFSIPEACFLLYCYIYWIQIGLNDLWYVRYVLLFKDHFKEFCFYYFYMIFSMENMIFLIALSWFASSDSFVFFAVFLVLRCCSREEPTNCFKLNTTQEFCLFSFWHPRFFPKVFFFISFLFWDVVANAVGVAGSLFISSGPFCTFQSEPRIY